MADRIYRLEVKYPDKPNLDYYHRHLACGCSDPDCPSHDFHWPRQRKYLSQSAANRRAELLRGLGADVEVISSEPIEWPETIAYVKKKQANRKSRAIYGLLRVLND